MTSMFYTNQNTGNLQKFCKEVFMMIPQVFYTQKDFYLIEELNKEIEILKASGLIDFWYHQFIDKITKVKDFRHQSALTLKKFQGCFEILLLGSFLSFLVFLCELWTFKRRRSKKKAKNMKWFIFPNMKTIGPEPFLFLANRKFLKKNLKMYITPEWYRFLVSQPKEQNRNKSGNNFTSSLEPESYS